jgi:hypothetical protein
MASFRAGLFAHPAEDAAQHVDLVATRVAFPVRLGIVGRILGSLHEDRVGRARHRTQLTTHATLEAVAVAGEDVEPAEAREHLQLFVGILDGEGLLEEVLNRDPEALSQLFSACLSFLDGGGERRTLSGKASGLQVGPASNAC